MKRLLREQMVGKTVNFYSNKSETTLSGQYKILNIKTQGDQNVYLTISSALPNSKSIEFGGLKKYYDNTINTFTENADKFEVSIKCFDLSPGFKDPHDNKKIYNSKLEEDVRRNYCTKNKSGVTVPKSDYTMTSNSNDQSLAEGKRVIQLTESELIKLIKRIIKEEEESPQYKYRLGQGNEWYDEEDRQVTDTDISDRDYEEEVRFGLRDYDKFGDYIKDIKHKWPFHQKGQGDMGKEMWKQYTKNRKVPMKIRKIKIN